MKIINWIKSKFCKPINIAVIVDWDCKNIIIKRVDKLDFVIKTGFNQIDSAIEYNAYRINTLPFHFLGNIYISIYKTSYIDEYFHDNIVVGETIGKNEYQNMSYCEIGNVHWKDRTFKGVPTVEKSSEVKED